MPYIGLPVFIYFFIYLFSFFFFIYLSFFKPLWQIKLIKLLEYSKICIASNFEFFKIKRYKKCKQAFLRCNKITTKASKRDENPQLYAHLSIVVYICEHTGQFSTFVNRHIIGRNCETHIVASKQLSTQSLFVLKKLIYISVDHFEKLKALGI